MPLRKSSNESALPDGTAVDCRMENGRAAISGGERRKTESPNRALAKKAASKPPGRLKTAATHGARMGSVHPVKRLRQKPHKPRRYIRGAKDTKSNPRTGRLQGMRAAIPAPVEHSLSRPDGRLRFAAAGGFRRSGNAPPSSIEYHAKSARISRTLFECGLPQWERPACLD